MHATRVWLALFDSQDDDTPYQEFELIPDTHRTGHVWSIFVEGLAPGALYMYRVDGPAGKDSPHRYDSRQFLLDPYAREFAGAPSMRRPKCRVVATAPTARAVLPKTMPPGQTIVYEVHLRGFTQHPSAGVADPGTFRGFIEKIPYLKDLGVTAVEFLPIQECGEYDVGRKNPDTGDSLTNFWGYNTIGFFAPNRRYASEGAQTPAGLEFRNLVDALHDAGMEVYLDVVYNHTSERNDAEGAQCFRGIDNAVYYMTNEKGEYRDFTGCGNTLDCTNSVVREFILDSLRYWRSAFGIDGFRFDLAAVFRRDGYGQIVPHTPVISRIAEDPVLHGARLIAEPWDVGGAYLVGSFGDSRWSEWNGKYRDDVRRFWKGDRGVKGDFALRLTGSPDLFQDDGRTPLHSVNFVTAHDGFTLRDLVSYNEKHNEPNGESSRDGHNDNHSWNCGIEGDSDDPEIKELRMRMQKSYLATLFTSLGTPMLLAGDELGRTQQGNNNAYCQDNEVSWVDWSLLDENAELFNFCKEIIQFRRENAALTKDTYFTGRPNRKGGEPDLLWFNAGGDHQRWDPDDLSLACLIDSDVNNGLALYIMFNPSLMALQFRIPRGNWKVRVDTAKRPPRDIMAQEEATQVNLDRVIVGRKAVMILSGILEPREKPRPE